MGNDKVKLLALCTPSHLRLCDEWFLPSVSPDFSVELKDLPQDGVGRYRDNAFKNAVRSKVEMVRDALSRNKNEILVVSDVDVQFFGPVLPILRESLRHYDFVSQSDGPSGYCCGFFALRTNAAMQKLFDDVAELLARDASLTEQPAVNSCIEKSAIKAQLLPRQFYGPGIDLNREEIRKKSYLWEPGMTLNIPNDIVMHHANWTIGVENKIAQLRYVREVIEHRRNAELSAIDNSE